MSITVTLPEELENKVQEAAARNGRAPADYIIEALEKAVQPANGANADDLLDWEYIRACQAEADPSVSLAAVRQALSKIPGTLTADFNAERDER